MQYRNAVVGVSTAFRALYCNIDAFEYEVKLLISLQASQNFNPVLMNFSTSIFLLNAFLYIFNQNHKISEHVCMELAYFPGLIHKLFMQTLWIYRQHIPVWDLSNLVICNSRNYTVLYGEAIPNLKGPIWREQGYLRCIEFCNDRMLYNAELVRFTNSVVIKIMLFIFIHSHLLWSDVCLLS